MSEQAPRGGFLKAGHLPTLVAALLYFDVSFMVWVVLGPLAPYLRDQFGLSASSLGLLVATPLLGGSLFRPVMGTLADQIGGRRVALMGMTLTLVPLFVGWKVAHEAWHLYPLALMLGIAGASFAVALPLASRWYPPEYQGLAMGIAGAGNSGSLLATLAAPRIAERFGWATTFGLMAAPVLLVMSCLRSWPKTARIALARLPGANTFRCSRKPTRCGSRFCTASPLAASSASPAF